ncbi:MAG TPA: oxygen-independent coproporphyrinogen III oxidase [Devosia sp.]|nr:oxygen-independent coproporphyrinogen III oxidase [Devosia sp.]
MTDQSASISLAQKYGSPVPRYTSYPTAPHFSESVNEGTYRGWLGALGGSDTLSLYLHVPFCDRLCWFCGCHTKQTLRYDPISTYVAHLLKEIDLVAAAVGGAPKVSNVHFGGGSPSMLRPDDLGRIIARLRAGFSFGERPEISIEVDPGDITPDRVEAMAEAGLSRASIGVQDFDEKVQEAINRPQSFELTSEVISAMRGAGVHSVNLDVLYGLPHQTETTLSSTIQQVVSLAPDRVALFGYAHVPWMKTHMKMIDESALADIDGRFAQAQLAASLLVEAGYERIGFDHFARHDDTMAVAARGGRLRRNFQGYTDDPASALVGMGASAIGETVQGYVQNIVPTGLYMAAIKEGRLPVAKGFALGPEDIARRWVIERLMCDMALSQNATKEKFGELAGPILLEAADLAQGDEDGLFVADGDTYRVTEAGRPFVRVLAAHFDAYLKQGKARHSVAV